MGNRGSTGGHQQHEAIESEPLPFHIPIVAVPEGAVHRRAAEHEKTAYFVHPDLRDPRPPVYAAPGPDNKSNKIYVVTAGSRTRVSQQHGRQQGHG